MLNCKQVATLASDYLDNNTSLRWQIRLHLLMCANCRRFIRHLRITREVGARMAINEPGADAEAVWNKVQTRIKKEAQPDQE
jgi:hypothetical protein